MPEPDAAPPLRVALVTLAPTDGGVIRHMRDLATGLAARGHAVTVASPPGVTGFRRWADARGVTWTPVSRAAGLAADVWHLHLHNSLDRAALPLVAARRMRRPRAALIVTEHLPRTALTDAALPLDPGLPPGRPKPAAEQLKQLYKALELGVADAVLCPGAGAARFLEERWRGLRRPVTVIPNGVPPPVPLPWPAPAEPLRVLAVGALGWQKGLDLLLAADHFLVAPVQLDVLGDGPMRARLEAAARGCERLRVRFHGWRDDVAAALAAAELVALPSRWECHPYAALDAHAAGRPLLVTRVDGSADIVADEVTGRVVAAENPAALAAGLAWLSERRAALPGLGAAGAERVGARFGLEAMLAAHARLYAELARART